jgi:uncharacterized membrane-anchored protein YjiN (DUF445 family)
VTLPEETETEETLPEPPVETVPSETETEEESSPSEEATFEPEEIASVIESLPDDASAEEVAEAVLEALSDASSEEIGEVLNSVFEDASPEQIVAILSAVFEDASPEEVLEILETAFADGATDEQVAAVTEALLSDGATAEAVGTLIDIFESGIIDSSQVQAAVDSILETGVGSEAATELASSPAVLESITPDQATQVFVELVIGQLSEEQEAELVAALTEAPTEIKEVFEEEINIFQEGLDEYTGVGSSVDVGTRRSLIAAGAAVASIGASIPSTSSGGSTGGSGGSAGGGGAPSGGGGSRRRKAG